MYLIIIDAIVDIIINPVAISILYLYDITNVIESRIKISEKLKGRPGTMKGRKHTEESIQKMKIIQRELAEKNPRISSWNKGIRHSEKGISHSQKGIRHSQKGIRHSEKEIRHS
jgi:peptidoglycan hydrolase CwlO-like protein